MIDSQKATNPDEGWWFPGLSRKAHYFREGRSLCGKWGTFGQQPLTPDTHKSPDDCAACRRKLDREKATS
jgi:hypothetical protein